MKHCVPSLFLACIAPVAAAQVQNGPAQPPVSQQNVQMGYDGKCANAKAGDVVSFTLTIEAVESAKSVYGELQMRQGRGGREMQAGLPLPDARSLAGGGLGTRDPQSPMMYHFSMKVPAGLLGGVYHGIGVMVTVDRPPTTRDREAARDIDVNRHTRDQVKKYCLNVTSGFDSSHPLVTNFTPDGVQTPAPPPSPTARK